MMNHGWCPAHKVAAALVWIGAVNWGLIGFLKFDLVAALLGNMSMPSRIVYALVGLSALFMLACCKCKMCVSGGSKAAAPAPKM